MEAARADTEHMKRDPAALTRDRRGAVYVEFLAMFVPILAVFMGLAETSFMYSAKLVTQHAAVMGVRAAAVVLPDDPKHYDGVGIGEYAGARKEKIEKAVAMTLLAGGNIVDWEVELLGGGGQPQATFDQGSNYPMATVRVEADYSCSLFRLACGFSGSTTLVSEASMPVHMAPYTYPE